MSASTYHATLPLTRRAPPWAWYALLGVLASVVYFQPLPSQVRDVLYDVIGVSAALACWVGARHVPTERRRGWQLLGAGLALLVLGDIVYNWYSLVRHTEAPFPGVADVLYLGGIPVLFRGLQALAPRRRSEGNQANLLDAVMLTIGLGVLLWIFLVDSLVADETLSFAGRLVAVAYPMTDLLLAHVLARRLLATRMRNTSELLLLAGLAAMLVADLGYAYLQAAGSYTSGHPIDAGWLAMYVAFGVAALHQDASTAGAIDIDVPHSTSARRIVFVVALWAACASTLLRSSVRNDTDSLVVVLVGLFAIFGIAQQRLAAEGRRVTRRLSDLGNLASHELRTPLTGLLGGLDTLERAAALPPGDRAELMAIVRRQAERIQDVSRDLAALAAADRLEAATGPVDLGDVIQSVLRDLDPQLRVRAHVDWTGPLYAVADVDALCHALGGLVRTALEESPSDSAVIIEGGHAGGLIRLRVRSDAPVLARPVDHLSVGSHEQRSSGLGIKLQVAQRLVGAMGGRIRVERTAEGRSCLALLLPAAHGHEAHRQGIPEPRRTSGDAQNPRLLSRSAGGHRHDAPR